jgi:hypothetical protein
MGTKIPKIRKVSLTVRLPRDLAVYRVVIERGLDRMGLAPADAIQAIVKEFGHSKAPAWDKFKIIVDPVIAERLDELKVQLKQHLYMICSACLWYAARDVKSREKVPRQAPAAAGATGT